MSDTPENIGLNNKSEKERDQTEFNQEIAGLENGRIKRFLNGSEISVNTQKQKKKDEEHMMSMLLYLLEHDEQYRKLFLEVQDKLNRAQHAVKLAMLDLEQRLAESGRTLLKMENDAAQLEDGTKVFLSENNSIYTINGTVLSAADAQDITIPEGAPSWEAYNAQREWQEALVTQKRELDDYQRDVLDEAKARLDDTDNPVSIEELEDISNQIEQSMPQLAVGIYSSPEETASNSSVAFEIEGEALTVPDLNGAFTHARNDTPAPATQDSKPQYPTIFKPN